MMMTTTTTTMMMMMMMMVVMMSFSTLLILVDKFTCTFNVLTHMHFSCVGWGVGICYYPWNLRTHVINGPFKRQKEHLKSLEKNAITQTDPNLKSIASEYLTIHRDRYTQEQACKVHTVIVPARLWPKLLVQLSVTVTSFFGHPAFLSVTSCILVQIGDEQLPTHVRILYQAVIVSSSDPYEPFGFLVSCHENSGLFLIAAQLNATRMDLQIRMSAMPTAVRERMLGGITGNFFGEVEKDVVCCFCLFCRW